MFSFSLIYFRNIHTISYLKLQLFRPERLNKREIWERKYYVILFSFCFSSSLFNLSIRHCGGHLLLACSLLWDNKPLTSHMNNDVLLLVTLKSGLLDNGWLELEQNIQDTCPTQTLEFTAGWNMIWGLQCALSTDPDFRISFTICVSCVKYFITFMHKEISFAGDKKT